MKKKLTVLILAAALAITSLTGCAGGGAKNSADATAEKPMVLNLAHSLQEGHITSVALQEFCDLVNENTDGRIKINVFPNGTLGSENEVLEQLMAGVMDMTRVAAPGLATYNEGYHTFGLPYIFKDNEDYYKVMGSDEMGEFFRSSEDDGFVTLTYYTSGARSFYTNKPIRKPEDLKGLKIRVQDMKSQTDMMKALGGTPVAMSVNDVYTALQTGILDGAESNETALTIGKHGEVCKYFSYDQHTMIPDVLIISTSAWERISEADQQIIIDAAKKSTEDHIISWEDAINSSVEEAKTTMGVEFVEDVDKEAFRNATADMISEYREAYPKVGEVLDIINSVE